MAGIFDHGDGLPGKIWEGIAHGALFGCILGLLQLLCFSYRRQSIQWLLSSIILWSFSAAVADGVRTLMAWKGPVEFMIALPLSALLSGVALNYTLKNNIQS